MTRRPRLPPPTSPSVVSYDAGRACDPRGCQLPSPPHQFSASCESNPGSLVPSTGTVAPVPPPRNCSRPSPPPPGADPEAAVSRRAAPPRL
eukprot:2874367-Rhodomonas_salina.1